MTGVATMTSIIELLFSAFTTGASALGGGISSLVTGLLYTGSGETQQLSAFMQLVVIFAGISLLFGLCRWVLNFLSSLGARNR